MAECGAGQQQARTRMMGCPYDGMRGSSIVLYLEFEHFQQPTITVKEGLKPGNPEQVWVQIAEANRGPP